MFSATTKIAGIERNGNRAGEQAGPAHGRWGLERRLVVLAPVLGIVPVTGAVFDLTGRKAHKKIARDRPTGLPRREKISNLTHERSPLGAEIYTEKK